MTDTTHPASTDSPAEGGDWLDMICAGASDLACYLYPGVKQDVERAAFVAGVAHQAALSRPAPIEPVVTRDALIDLLSHWFETKVYGFHDTGEAPNADAEFSHFVLADDIIALLSSNTREG